ncbi:hypothetical protein [Rhodobacter capsulatus]|uniref:hypothetical protein n=1 Tax=Rhodobacter capsulatus TaxID=1061 RepID=UPI00103FA318|nr:hypothetical protein [Rhodobacter capsulatus]
MIALLIEIGQLQCVQDHHALASKIGKAVDGRGVKPILRFLETRFQSVDKAPEGFVHLSKSAEKSRARVKVILELMFHGHLKRVYRVTGAHGFAAVVVDPEEIKALLESLPVGLSEDSYFLMDCPSEPDLSQKPCHAAFGRHFLRIFDGHFYWVKWPSRGSKAYYAHFGLYISMGCGAEGAANGQ